MKKFFIFLFLGIFLSMTVHARAELDHKILPLLPEHGDLIHLSYSYSGRSDFKSVPTDDLAYHTIDFGGQIPIPITDRFIFGLGIKYNFINARINNITAYLPQNGLNLHQLGIALDGIFFIGDRWFLNVNFTPTLATDFKSLDGDDFQYNGLITAGVALSDVTALYFGAGIGKDFWRYLPYPVLGLVWRPADSFFNLEAILPAYVKLNFKVAEPVTIFALSDFNGQVWDVEGNGGVPDHFLKASSLRTGAGVKIKLIKGLFLSLQGGVYPFRRVEYRDNTNTEIEDDLKLGYYAEGMFSISPELFGM